MNYFCALLLLAVPVSALAERSARDIMDEQYDRHRVSNETTHVSLTLIDRKGYEEVRTLRRLRSEQPDGLSRALTVFDAPADVKGTALLTRENKEKDNDQWLYLPSQRRMLRIAQSRRSGYFMGTDFTYEDMDPDNIDDYAYRLLGSEELDGSVCYLIEAVSADEKKERSSGYGKRKLWIRQDIVFTIQIEYFDRKGRLLKRQKNTELTNIRGDIWRAQRSFMDNTAKNHQTIAQVVQRDIDAEIPDEMFSERSLRSGRYMN